MSEQYKNFYKIFYHRKNSIRCLLLLSSCSKRSLEGIGPLPLEELTVVRCELGVPKSSFERSTPYFHQLTPPLKMTLALSRGESSVWYKMCEQLLWSCTRAQEVWESERRPEVR